MGSWPLAWVAAIRPSASGTGSQDRCRKSHAPGCSGLPGSGMARVSSVARIGLTITKNGIGSATMARHRRSEMRRAAVRLVLVAATLLTAWAAASQTAKTPGPLRLQPVREGLRMISGEGGNVAVDVTTAGVVLVDDMFDRN